MMKVKVNRLLTAGKYHINFEVGDFTPEELGKMSSFGVPAIAMKGMTNMGLTPRRIALTQITKSVNATFETEEQAKAYEDDVLKQIKVEMQRLRENKDEFSSSDEVDL